MMKSTIKATALITLALTVFVGLFSEPQDSLEPGAWMKAFIISKSIAVAAGFTLAKLYSRWRKTDKLIMWFEKQNDVNANSEDTCEL